MKKPANAGFMSCRLAAKLRLVMLQCQFHILQTIILRRAQQGLQVPQTNHFQFQTLVLRLCSHKQVLCLSHQTPLSTRA